MIHQTAFLEVSSGIEVMAMRWYGTGKRNARSAGLLPRGASFVKNPCSHGPRCSHAPTCVKSLFHILEARTHTHTQAHLFATSLKRLRLKGPRQSPIINDYLSNNVRLRPPLCFKVFARPFPSLPCPYLPSAAYPATPANRISAPFSILTYLNPRHPVRGLVLILTLTPALVEDLRSLLGVRTGDRLRRLVTRTRERSEEASRPRAHPSLPPDMTMAPVPSYPTPSTAPASPVSPTAISTGGEPGPSAAVSLPTAANPPSQCLLSHRPPTFLLPLVPGLHASTAQVAVPPLPITDG